MLHSGVRPTEDLRQQIEVSFGSDQVKVLSEKPSFNETKNITTPAIWPSRSRPGCYGVFFPKHGDNSSYKIIYESVSNAREAITNYSGMKGIIEDATKKLEEKLNAVSDRLECNSSYNNVCKAEGAAGKQFGRFNNIHSNDTTRVHPELHANLIKVSNEKIAIVSQSPYQHQILAQLKMLVAQKSPVAAVLTSSAEMQNPKNNHTSYFSNEQRTVYGDMATECKLKKSINLDEETGCNIYEMKIFEHDKHVHSVNVYHVLNWPDHGVISKNAIRNLTEQLNQYTDGLPVINCNAGVGRSGVINAVKAMFKLPKNITLETTLSDSRISRNGHMIQTREQLRIVTEIALAQGRPLFNK